MEPARLGLWGMSAQLCLDWDLGLGKGAHFLLYHKENMVHVSQAAFFFSGLQLELSARVAL